MILIKSANIIDGSGKAPVKGDILIKGDRISVIGSFPSSRAETVIDGLGMDVVPGFIDVHSTSDHYLTLFTNPLQKDFLLQGITTIIGGNCGASLAPILYGSLKPIRKWADTDLVNVDWATIKELKRVLQKINLGVNFGTLAGHSTIRRDLVGEETRDLTQPELEIFKNSLRQALEEGALGLSTGLSYAHSRYIPYAELKHLLTAIAGKGVYATHLRDEREGLVDSIKETIQLTTETGLPTIISHLRPFLGSEKQFEESLNLINQNLNQSNLYFEINPFDVSVVAIYTLLPAWAKNGNLETMLGLIIEAEQRKQIIQDWGQAKLDPSEMIIVEAKGNPYLVGKTVKEFSDSRGFGIYDGLLVLMEITRLKTILSHKNINLAMLTETIFNPRSLIGTNSASVPERSTKTFTRFLEITRSRNIPLEEAVKKITYLPAKIFGFSKRGLLKEGWFADLAMLKDGQVVNVIVNGSIAVQDGKVTGATAGRPL